MKYILMLTGNKLLIAALVGWFIAQSLKVLLCLFKLKKLDWRRLVGSGGMPSSHSAFVCALATGAARFCGLDSAAFAISAAFAFVVMYDAAGVRRAAGKQASLLNKIVGTPGLSGVQVTEKLVEVLGHTPLQVVVGAVIGIVIGLLA